MATNIVIIGGRENIILLIDLFSNLININLVGICDSDENSPAMKYAKEKNIKTSTKYSDFVFNTEIDIIIENSGSKEFQKILYGIIPKNTIVLDSKAAEIMIEIAQEKDRARIHNELFLIEKIFKLFDFEHDIISIVTSISKEVINFLDVSACAILLSDITSNYKLTIVSKLKLNNNVTENIINYIQNESKKIFNNDIKNFIDINFNVLNPDKPVDSLEIKNYFTIPILRENKIEGVLFLFSTKEIISNDHILLLSIITRGFGFFLENKNSI